MAQIAGKYNIIKKLGEGATGEVYLVEHCDLKTKYALKLLIKSVSDDEIAVSRFVNEARLLDSFFHKNTARLRDFGKNSDGRYYMTSDFCQGMQLSNYIDQVGKTDYHLALKIIIDILDVLVSAHKFGIVHRDIKPDNIIIDIDIPNNKYNGIKVLDFGIAKIKEDMNLGAMVDSNNPMKNIAMGTPQYMAPEQAAGEATIDYRADLYSTGIVLYELITGKVPFEGETIVQTLLMHLTQPVPTYDENLHIPSKLSQITSKALQKLPEHRYQSTQQFLDDCKELLNEPQKEETTIQLINENETYVINKEHEKEKTKILYIDDSEIMLNIVTHILTNEGYDVFTTSSPQNLHYFLFQENIDLLISDVNMPTIQGDNICKMLKQTMPDLKIALFSNIAENELEELANSSCADAYISKNQKPADWVKSIEKILKA